MNIRIFYKMIRTKHWSKNIFLFAPLFFSGQFTDSVKLVSLLSGFLAFSFLASSVYIFNDIVDFNEDKNHYKKKFRPIASSQISLSRAKVISAVFLLLGFSIASFLNYQFILVMIAYLSINILYTFKLKEISIVDVFIISLGFVLRIIAGGIIADVSVSHWLIIMTFLLALFLAVAKRRDDVLILNETGDKMRKSIQGYNLDFINSTISILSAVITVAYILYVTSEDVTSRFLDKPVYISGVFVILGLLRYLQITLVESDSGSPTRILFKDRFIQIVLLSWITFFIFIIYIL